MKKMMALLLAMLLCGTSLAYAAEGTKSELVIASTTKMNGCFYTDMFGNNTADIDVRKLLHGYSTIAWDQELSALTRNRTVVEKGTMLPGTDGSHIYTLTIQKGLTYSDGTPITAADYVFSILLASSPQARDLGAMTGRYRHLEGFDAYNAGESNVFTGVRLINDYQFSLKIAADSLPYFYEFEYINCEPSPIAVLCPGCKVADDGHGAYIQGGLTVEGLAAALLDEENGYLSHPSVTSGPYVLTAYHAELGEATFAINPYFVGDAKGQKPSIEKLTFRHIAPEEIANALEDGTVDLVNKVFAKEAIESAQKLTDDGKTATSTYARNGLSYLSFSCEQGPAQFAAVRQAVALCLDTDALAEAYREEDNMPVYGFYGVGQWTVQVIDGTVAIENATPGEAERLGALSLEALNPYSMDLEKAEGLLNEAGFVYNAQGADFDKDADTLRYRKDENGSLLPLTLRFAKTADNRTADYLAELLVPSAAQIGMEIVVEEMPFLEMMEHYDRKQDRTFDLFFLANSIPATFDYEGFVSGEDLFQGEMNTTGIDDEKLTEDAKLLSATVPGDYLSYCERWLQFQVDFNALLPVLPLYSGNYYDFYRVDLQGYEPAAYATWAEAILYVW